MTARGGAKAERNAELIRRYREGVGVVRLGQQFALNPTRVAYILKRAGVSAAEGGRAVKKERDA